MPETFSSPTRRDILVTSAAAGVASLLSLRSSIAADSTDEVTAIRPFSVNIPEADLADLRRRIAAVRWPDQETVDDGSQGPQLAKFQEIIRYWGDGL